jgi:1-deoxy-D-xylulose-5-phosphate reductoisomerase
LNPRRIALFGSTGSIGVNTLDVIRRHPEHYKIEYLTVNRNVAVLAEQVREFKPRAVVATDYEAAKVIHQLQLGVEVLSGEEGLIEVAREGEYDTLVGAMVGFSGLKPTIEAVRRGKRVCLANKETLVVAGELLTALARETGSEILPIDSEHSAIYQCLVGEDAGAVAKIILTASGGPFRTLPLGEFESITVESALKHPNWVMGQKITIDSATMMNKGLEIIEAMWLFAQPLSKIEVIVHPQSIVHSMVEFVDGSVKAQLGAPDMRLPIQYALASPERLVESYDLLDLLTSKPLEFYAPDEERFPCMRLARNAGERGGLFPTILNAANEVAVQAFLDRTIAFNDIPRTIEHVMNEAPRGADDPLSTNAIDESLKRVFACDQQVRARFSGYRPKRSPIVA